MKSNKVTCLKYPYFVFFSLLFSEFLIQQNFGADPCKLNSQFFREFLGILKNSQLSNIQALGDIRVDLLHHITPPYDGTGISPQDPPTIINICTSGNSELILGKALNYDEYREV